MPASLARSARFAPGTSPAPRAWSSHGSWHTQYLAVRQLLMPFLFLSKEISHSPTPESPVWVKWYLWMPFIYEIFHYELSIHLPSFKSIFSSIFPLWELCATRIANENIFCLLADCAALAALVANILAENFYQCNRLFSTFLGESASHISLLPHADGIIYFLINGSECV